MPAKARSLTRKSQSRSKADRGCAVFIVPPTTSAELSPGKVVPEVQEQEGPRAFTKGAVLFSVERASFTYVFIVIAKDSDATTKLVEKLAGADQFQGVTYT